MIDVTRFTEPARIEVTVGQRAGPWWPALFFPALAAMPELIMFGTLTRNADGAITSAPLVWPDGATGTYTADTLSSTFPGAVDGYHVTYPGVTYTQPTVTRDASGLVTVRPPIVAT